MTNSTKIRPPCARVTRTHVGGGVKHGSTECVGKRGVRGRVAHAGACFPCSTVVEKKKRSDEGKKKKRDKKTLPTTMHATPNQLGSRVERQSKKALFFITRAPLPA